MADAKLNWSEATVKSGKLAVPLAGEVPKGWKAHFETTVKLLGHGEWGEVQLKKKAIHVGDIEAGDEDNLRFYLEGVVEQANSAADAEQSDKASKKTGSGSEPEPEGPDAKLTERFRSFAEQDSEPDAEGDES